MLLPADVGGGGGGGGGLEGEYRQAGRGMEGKGGFLRDLPGSNPEATRKQRGNDPEGARKLQGKKLETINFFLFDILIRISFDLTGIGSRESSGNPQVSHRFISLKQINIYPTAGGGYIKDSREDTGAIFRIDSGSPGIWQESMKESREDDTVLHRGYLPLQLSE